MRLSVAKDKILSSLILDPTNDTSIKLSLKLGIPHYQVSAGLVEMKDDAILTLIDTATSGCGGDPSYSLERITGKGFHFNKTKSFRSKSFWDYVKHFLGSYWGFVGFAIAFTVAIYQRVDKKEDQRHIQEQILKIKELRDSLYNLKK